jgi:hypothetical protein
MINRKNLKLFIMIMWARSEELLKGIEMAIQGKKCGCLGQSSREIQIFVKT